MSTLGWEKWSILRSITLERISWQSCIAVHSSAPSSTRNFKASMPPRPRPPPPPRPPWPTPPPSPASASITSDLFRISKLPFALEVPAQRCINQVLGPSSDLASFPWTCEWHMASLDTSNMLNICTIIHGFSDLEQARIVEDSEGMKRYDVEICGMDERNIKSIADTHL